MARASASIKQLSALLINRWTWSTKNCNITNAKPFAFSALNLPPSLRQEPPARLARMPTWVTAPASLRSKHHLKDLNAAFRLWFVVGWCISSRKKRVQKPYGTIFRAAVSCFSAHSKSIISMFWLEACDVSTEEFGWEPVTIASNIRVASSRPYIDSMNVCTRSPSDIVASTVRFPCLYCLRGTGRTGVGVGCPTSSPRHAEAQYIHKPSNNIMTQNH